MGGEINMQSEMEEAIWTAHTLFDRQLVTGSSANISFRQGDTVYISRSGAIFGRLGAPDFVRADMNGSWAEGQRPSKEFPLHLSLYRSQPQTRAVIHTHSFYTTLWSCLPDLDSGELFPCYTPYLNMQFQDIKVVPYHKPGSQELFQAFGQAADNRADGYILKNHGAVATGRTMLETFSKVEELETSARLAWELRGSSFSF